MGFRYRKSIKLGGGVRLNLSKRGVGVSVGIKGLRVGVGPRGVRTTASIPGTGLSYQKETGWGARKSKTHAHQLPSPSSSYSTNTSLFDIYVRGVPDDRPTVPKRRLFGNNSEYKRLKPVLINLDLAISAMRASTFDLALPLLQEACSVFPSSKYVKVTTALAFTFTEHPSEAHKLFRTLPNYNNDPLQLLRVRCALAAEDSAYGLELIDSLSPDKRIDDDVVLLRAGALVGLKEFNAALEGLKSFNVRKSVNKGQNATVYYYLRGHCYEELGRMKQALASYEKALAYPTVEGMNLRDKIASLREN